MLKAEEAEEVTEEALTAGAFVQFLSRPGGR
jgi:hypothetical protein